GEWRTVPAAGPGRTLQPDEGSLFHALHTAREADPWAAANGTSLRLLADHPAPGWKMEIAVLAGGTPDSLLQSLVATITLTRRGAPSRRRAPHRRRGGLAAGLRRRQRPCRHRRPEEGSRLQDRHAVRRLDRLS